MFDKAIYPRLGARRAEVFVPPQHGVVDLGDGSVFVVKTDPVYIAPQIRMRTATRFAVNILAKTSRPRDTSAIRGHRPKPTPSITDEKPEELWSSIHEALAEISGRGGRPHRPRSGGNPSTSGFICKEFMPTIGRWCGGG